MSEVVAEQKSLCLTGEPTIQPENPERKSPSIVIEQATEPEETAHQVTMDTTEPTVKDEELEDIASIPTDSLITKEMVEEEKHLHQETLEQERKIKEKAQEEWEQELHEQRYRRLQHLLQKSSVYTNFLLLKMEQQQEKENKRQARLAAKKKKQEEQAATEKESSQGHDEIDSGGSMDVGDTFSQESQDSNKEATVVEANTGRRMVTRGRSKSQEQPQEKPQADKVPAKKGGRKRKAEIEKDSYNIADVINKEELENKRRKLNSFGDDEKIIKDEEKSTAITKPTVKEGEDTVDTFSRIINGERVSDKQPLMFTGGVLRQYQIEGMEWLKVIYENGVNGILADEMGLGKTVQCIALLAHLVNMGVPGPFLICAPLSTLPNWVSEFQRFTPKVPILLYHGSVSERGRVRRDIRRKHGVKQTHPIVITSYEIVMNDRKHLQGYEWKYIIVDEGHRIKNLKCRLIRELKMYKSANRLLLTGTPLQNNLAELWSMLNFLLPEVFDDLQSFESWFDFQSIGEDEEAIVAREQENNILGMLHQILTPFLLRRLKTDVELKIPPKREVLVYAPLTKLQHYYYKATVDKTILSQIEANKTQGKPKVELDNKGRPKRRCSSAKVNYRAMVGDDSERDDIVGWFQQFTKNASEEKNEETPIVKESSVVNIKLQNIMMQLRKCCNHPYLLEYPINPKTNDYLINEKLIEASGKFLILERLLPQLKARGHKVLMFSQMTTMLDILSDYCYLRKYNFCRLDGSMSYSDRQEQIAEFNKNQDAFIFLLSTRAGGLGINLASADTVIIYDSDWNPQSDLQAQDRCHRIGQTKPVVVYRLVTSNTIDQKIVERAAAKRKLEKMVIHQGKFKGGKSNIEKDAKSVINPKELLELLRAQNHDGVTQSDQNHFISDEALEKLLDRSDLMLKHQQNIDAMPSTKIEVPETDAESAVFKVINEDSNDKMDIRLS